MFYSNPDLLFLLRKVIEVIFLKSLHVAFFTEDLFSIRVVRSNSIAPSRTDFYEFLIESLSGLFRYLGVPLPGYESWKTFSILLTNMSTIVKFRWVKLSDFHRNILFTFPSTSTLESERRTLLLAEYLFWIHALD